jgi:hypothetical protein
MPETDCRRGSYTDLEPAPERGDAKSIQTPDLKARLANIGGEPIPARAAEFWKVFNDDIERYVRLVREGKVKPIQ